MGISRADTSANSVIRLTKAFVLSVLVSATLAKLGEAGFNSFWATVEHSDLTEPMRAYRRLGDSSNISVFVFIVYFLLVLVRHLGATHSTEILLGIDPRRIWQRNRFAKFLPVVDFVATFLMFMCHYVAAYGLSEAVKGGTIALSGWPIGVVPALLLALLLDVLICVVGITTARLAQGQAMPESVRELRDSNIYWLVASLLEFGVLLVAMYVITTSLVATLAIALAIFVSVCDLACTWRYWSRMALLSAP